MARRWSNLGLFFEGDGLRAAREARERSGKVSTPVEVATLVWARTQFVLVYTSLVRFGLATHGETGSSSER